MSGPFVGSVIATTFGDGARLIMFKHKWTKTIALAGLLALPATASMAGTVEMVVIPCTPQMRPEDCGVKVTSSEGTVTFTTNSGQVITVGQGTSLTVAGDGTATQSNGANVNFAALTTGSVGGGGGGASGSPLPSGGNNSGSSGSSSGSSTSGGGTNFVLTGGGVTGGSSGPVSAH